MSYFEVQRLLRGGSTYFALSVYGASHVGGRHLFEAWYVIEEIGIQILEFYILKLHDIKLYWITWESTKKEKYFTEQLEK